MKVPRPVVVDFETYGIDGRPDYPPAPVGAAIKRWGKKGKYYAWGHPTGNNCTFEQGQRALAEVWDGPLLFHNAKFDLDVAEIHCGLPLTRWDAVHDTTFLLFLDDPHSRTVDLKGAAQRLLGMAPEERDAVAEWLIANQPVPDVRITRKTSGRYIAYAPASVVGPYAIGDCERTEGLFNKLYASVADRGMLPAYDRERRLVPILLDMEQRGIRVDLSRLQRDVDAYDGIVIKLETWLRKRLGVGIEVNLESDDQLVAALVACGAADPDRLLRTPSGKPSANKESLKAGVTDAQLGAALRYLAALRTCLGTFMRPWLAVAERSGGRIYCNWNQIRGETGAGARTGRFSSSPNFMNIPNEFEPMFTRKRGDGLPKAPFAIPPLPLCRGYIVPYEGHVLCGRDFASQELRVLAHFEDGAMQQSYVDKPDVDFHQLAADILLKMFGARFAATSKEARGKAKTIGFAILYGAGLAKLAAQLGVSYEEARRFLDAYLGVFPSIREMQRDIKARSAANQPIRTFGGREYYTAPPAIVNGKYMDFSYRQLNYLIQGSSADLTKDAMIRFYDRAGPGYLMLSVHDELLVSVSADRRDEIMTALREEMEAAGLDVPMLSDGECGETWGSMAKI